MRTKKNQPSGGKAVLKEAADFCAAYGMQTAMRFEVSLYGRERALFCGRYWCNKMTHYYRLWVDLGAPVPYEFTAADHALWKDPDYFEPDFNPHGQIMKALRRVNMLKELKPVGRGI